MKTFLKGLGLTLLVSLILLPFLGWLLAIVANVSLAIAMGVITPLLALIAAFFVLGGRQGRREMHLGWTVVALILAEIVLATLMHAKGFGLIAGVLLSGTTLLAILFVFHQHPGYRIVLWLVIATVLLVALLMFVAPLWFPMWSLALWHALLTKLGFLGFLKAAGPAAITGGLLFIPTCVAFFIVLIAGTDPVADHPAPATSQQKPPMKMPPMMIQGRNPLPGGEQPYPQATPVRPMRPSANPLDEDLDNKPVRGLKPSRQPNPPSQPAQNQAPRRPHRPIQKARVGDMVVVWTNEHGTEEEWMGEITTKKLGGGATINVAKMNGRFIKPRTMALPKDVMFDYLDEDEHNDVDMFLHPGQPKP